LAFEVLQFQKEATHIKSQTHIRSANDMPVYTPNLVQVADCQADDQLIE